MKIAMHFSPLWAANGCPTGTGQHVLYMADLLPNIPGVSGLHLVASKGSYARYGPDFPPALARLSKSLYSLPESWMRRIQLFSNLLSLDRWVGDADWIYCPLEQAAVTRRCKLAVMVHDLLVLEPAIAGIPSPSARMVSRWRLAMSRILERADLIATASEFTAGRIRELCNFKDDGRIHVIGNGVAPLFYQPGTPASSNVLKRYGVSVGRYLLAVGSLTWRKGGDILLDMARELARSAIELRIIVTGQRHDSELVAKMNHLKEEMPGLPIDLVGYVPDEDLATLYRSARAFVFPSRYEGFGIPVAEAMACGAPVICSDCPALIEVGHEAVISVSGNTATGMIHAVQELEADPDERRRRIEVGRIRAATYTWEHCASRLVQAMISKGSCTPP